MKLKMYLLQVLLLVVLCVLPSVTMALVPYVFINGTTADANQVNANFQFVDPSVMWKTGQTNCWDVSGNVISCASTGQDGDLLKSVAWPQKRFTDNGNGTVTDNVTKLIWLQNANCFGMQTWAQALNDANTLANNSCGLTDGSVAGKWRLPNIVELFSLVDLHIYGSIIVSNSPFSGLQWASYWSSSTVVANPALAFGVVTGNDSVSSYVKSLNFYYVWPVRDGQLVN